MKQYIVFIFSIILASSSAFAATSGKNPDVVAKHVRTFIKKGNEAYHSGQYDVAETYYKDALQEDPNSALAQFNLALALLRQQTAGNSAADTLRNMSKNYFQNVTGQKSDQSLVEKAYYNLGNISFDEKDYATSIEMYKEVLRRNPDNIKARQNLRVAQIKLKDQQNGQDKNDQNQDKKDNNQNNQNQDQNKDQKQDQQNQQNKDKEDKQNQGQPNQPKQSPEKPNDKKENSGSTGRQEISKENADKILKAAAKQEEQTRKKVEKSQKEQSTGRRIIGNPW